MTKDYKSLYLKYKMKYLKLKESNVMLSNMKGGGSESVDLILFRADWCPHCVAFENSWKQLESEKKEENVNFVVVEHNNEELINHYKDQSVEAKGFPTLFAKVNNEYLEYMGPMENDNIKKFLDTISH